MTYTILWIESEQHLIARRGTRRKVYCQSTHNSVADLLDCLTQSASTIYRNLPVKIRVNQYNSEINNNEMY